MPSLTPAQESVLRHALLDVINKWQRDWDNHNDTWSNPNYKIERQFELASAKSLLADLYDCHHVDVVTDTESVTPAPMSKRGRYALSYMRLARRNASYLDAIIGATNPIVRGNYQRRAGQIAAKMGHLYRYVNPRRSV